MTRRIYFIFSIIVALTSAICCQPTATAKTWDGSAGEWTDGAKWGGSAPGPGDDAIINSGSVLLTGETDELNSLTMSGGILTMSNWTTRLRATTVTMSGGTITIPAAFTNNMMSNRVWIACSNLTLAAGAKIDAEGKGWSGKPYGENSQAGFGPGGSSANRHGAAYGGYGRANTYSWLYGTLPYGSVTEPVDPGSGGGGYEGNYAAGNGGGAVRIDATGKVIINGIINANASDFFSAGSGGAGGGIYIACDTIEGSGIVMADGSRGGGGANQGGGGGRIAVSYNSAAQELLAVPSITFACAAKSQGCDPGDIGTLWFPDERFLQREPLTGFTGQWYSASANLAFNQLTVSNAWLRFVNDGISLTVANELLLTTNARIEVGGNVLYSNFYWDAKPNGYGKLPRPVSEMTSNPRVECKYLTLTNGGALWIFAGLTNDLVQTGALAKVTEKLVISSNSWLYPVNHGKNGGHVVLKVGGLNIQPGGGINAVGLGLGNPDNRSSNVQGYGPGGGYYIANGIGAGYGGKGGNAQTTYGQTYGSSNTPPFYCGSGGGGYQGSGYLPSAGGGLVYIDAWMANVKIDGTIKADGGMTTAGCGAGSGGGVYIVCQGYAGAGRIQAEGGASFLGTSQVGGGGGGRIAIFRRPELHTFTGDYSVMPGTNYVLFIGETGTVYVGESLLPPAQGVVLSIR